MTHFTGIAGKSVSQRVLFLNDHFGLLTSAAARANVSVPVVSRAYKAGRGSARVERALLEEICERIGMEIPKESAA